ncbi:hypothetical protein ACFO4N_11045 [Camelliibacillus cellulosilyticus]|uniref:Uncharacterized protein n=1 Tax=Camelliibacillus cellulosilyticus TaxID=2174486 RepID=A0ABV9GRG8_9BACL
MGKKIKVSIFTLIFLAILLAIVHFAIGDSKQILAKGLLKKNAV